MSGTGCPMSGRGWDCLLNIGRTRIIVMQPQIIVGGSDNSVSGIVRIDMISA